MEPPASAPQTPRDSHLTRRTLLGVTVGVVGLSALSGCAAPSGVRAATSVLGPRPFSPASFDPWIEIDRAGFVHNVREAARLAGGRPILAVVKNNAYGLGDQAVGPLLADLPQVGGIACVRVEEAVALREAGVTKPIMVMAEGSEEEIEERADLKPVFRLKARVVRVERVEPGESAGFNRTFMPQGMNPRLPRRIV